MRKLYGRVQNHQLESGKGKAMTEITSMTSSCVNFTNSLKFPIHKYSRFNLMTKNHDEILPAIEKSNNFELNKSSPETYLETSTKKNEKYNDD